MFHLADFRADVDIAESIGVAADKSTLVRMYQEKLQVPAWIVADSTFVTCGAEARLVSFLEISLVKGVADWELFEMILMVLHLGSHMLTYGDDVDRSKSSTLLRHSFEWIVMTQTGCALTWDDFEVVRKVGSLLRIISGRSVLREGIILDRNSFPVGYPSPSKFSMTAGTSGRSHYKKKNGVVER